MNGKRAYAWGLATLLMALVLVGAEEKSHRETARDRVVSLRRDLLPVPEVVPLCEALKAKKRRVNVGDAELYVEVEGRGTPMVLLHGGPGATHHYFHPEFSRASEFSQVIYYDQRGCGISDYKAGTGYSVEQGADDLDKLRKALGIEKWVVVGSSYGGLLAQYYSVKYPDSLIGLVLVDASEAGPIKLEPTRQYDYMSKEERARIREIYSDKQLTEAQSVFNGHLNGDWKRQNYYKPTIDELARMALYEWKHDPAFRPAMEDSINRIDLLGAFDKCPIPTLIIEGRWDLTWNTDKPGKLQEEHPGSKLVMFEQSAHLPFSDEPERFFAVLKEFVSSVHAPSAGQIAAWKEQLSAWRSASERNPTYMLTTLGNGHAAYQRIVEHYEDSWLTQLNDSGLLRQLGMALYDMRRYETALEAFRRAQQQAEQDHKREDAGVALLWQGQMLDLLGRRKDAIAVYEAVVKMDLTVTYTYSQFGLSYQPSAYARQLMKQPFARMESQ